MNKKKPSSKLPIRDSQGHWHQQEPITSDESSNEEPNSQVDFESETLDESQPSRNVMASSNYEQVLDLDEQNKKIYIGYLASSIISDAVSHLEKLKILIGYAQSLAKARQKSCNFEEQEEFSKLLLVSLLAIFQDILPEYSIRSLSESELSSKISKQVKEQRQYEFLLLSSYKTYLCVLFSIVASQAWTSSHLKKLLAGNSLFSSSLLRKTFRHSAKIQSVALKCLLELFLSKLKFNYHLELGQCLVSLALFFDKRADSLLEMICGYFQEAFFSDSTGYMTWFLLKALSNAVFENLYNVPSLILKSLLSIKLENLNHSSNVYSYKSRKRKQRNAEATKAPVHISRTTKKLVKKNAKWTQELDKADFEISLQETNSWHQESLDYLFRIYIGIIKKNPNSKACLGNVFKGFSKFSSVIDQQYFGDLLHSFKFILQSRASPNLSTAGGHLNVETCLFCLNTIFVILHEQQPNHQSIQLDLHYYYKFLYNLLLEIPGAPIDLASHPVSHRPTHNQKSKKHTSKNLLDFWTPVSDSEDPQINVGKDEQVQSLFDTLLNCVNKMFFCSKNIPLERITAFIQRFIWLCLSLQSKYILLVLGGIIFKFFKHYPKAISLVLPLSSDDEDEQQGEYSFGNGFYLPSIDDPDLCNSNNYSAKALIQLFIYLHPNNEVKQRFGELLKLNQDSLL